MLPIEKNGKFISDIIHYHAIIQMENYFATFPKIKLTE